MSFVVTSLTRLGAVAGLAVVLAAGEPAPPRQSALVAPAAGSDARSGPPELPRVRVDVPEIRVTGRTSHVPAGGDLQQAIDAAAPGDRITLEPGATYRGPFRFRQKKGDGWVIIASAGRLPPSGRHVRPADADQMPRIVAASGSAIEFEPGAHHVRLVGLEIAPAPGASLNPVVRIGLDERSADALPHHVIVDRCYIHGDPRLGSRRGIALNGAHVAVVDSYIADFKERTVDAQAIGGWNGPGPFLIANNYLEASGENVMFGGADPRIQGLVPADIEVRGNHLAKPLRWKKDDPAFEGTEWSVKNLFELKNARRVLIDGNLLEFNWPHAQNGFAILFTVRNQDGGAPWSVVEDVTFSNNVVRHVAAGINILGRDDNQPSQQTRRIAIRNNLFLDVGGRWGNGRLFQLLHGTADVAIEHNTAVQTGTALFGGDSEPHQRFVFQHNVLPLNEHGIIGSSAAPGLQSLQRYFPDGVVRRNLFIGGPPRSYPPDNLFAESLREAGLDPDGATVRRPDARLAARTSDGQAIGADVAAIERALGGLAAAVRDLPGRTARAADEPAADSTNAVMAGVAGAPLQLASVLDLAAIDPVGLAVFVFWLSAALLAYTYVGYPVVAALRAAVQPRRPARAPIEPTVSIVVVAFNEEDKIGGRIENLADLDYPTDRLQIVVASDGSTDATVARAREYEGGIVSVLAFRRRRGKAAVISAVVPRLRSDIVVFADARQRFERGTLRALVNNFADPSVGGVSGELVLTTRNAPAAAGRGAAFYWRYEKFIRSTEGRADSTIGATGAIYAIRRTLFEPIPEDTILDDVLIPLRVVRQGYRVVFEPGARAFDCASSTARQEFVRKARTIAGSFQLFARERWLLSPRSNRLWFETVSHKLLRLLLPALHAALLVSSIVAAGGWLYGVAAAAQGGFYAAGFAGYAQRRWRSVLFTIPSAMCVLLWATVVGFYRFATHRQQATWERTPSFTASARKAGSAAAA